MKHYAVLFCFLLFLACNSTPTADNAPLITTTYKTLTGKVVAVKDGDTIELLVNGKQEKVRFFGVDCPERKQAFGTKAKEFTSRFCYGKVVTVEINEDRDQYNRILGTIFVDGKNLNEELVKAGLAWRYKHSKNKTLADLETAAREQGVGLWADNEPVAPWDFRKKENTGY